MRYAAICFSVLAISAILTVPGARAEDPDLTKAFDAESAFEFLKSLAGDWEGTAVSTLVGSDEEGSTAPASVSYRVSGNNSMVVATYGAGTNNEMLTIYHQDGPGELMLTHYCALRNQPKMRLRAVKGAGVLQFDFAGGTNFDPAKDRHVHETTVRVIDKDTIESTSIGYNQGKPATIRVATLKRIK